jgi:hypothetical protein
MEHVLASLEEMADVVIIDGPPCFLADAWILAAKASGVLCLLRLGSTSVRAAQAMLQQLERSGARLLGLALNRTTVQPAYYYGKYRPAQRAPGQRRPNDKAVQPSELGHQPSLGGGFIQRMRLKGPTIPPKTSPPPAVVEERNADRWSNPAYGMQHEGRLPVQATEHTEAVTDLVASQRALASMDLIASLGRDLGEGFEIEVLSQRVLQHTLQGLGASSGSLLVFDEAGTVAAGAVAYLGQVQSSTIKQLSEFVERGLAGWVLQHQEAVRIDSTRDDLRWLRRPWEEPDGASRSVISAPVIAHDRVAAVITLVHPRAGHFTSQDLALLKVVAACISFNGAPALRQAGNGPASGDA